MKDNSILHATMNKPLSEQHGDIIYSVNIHCEKNWSHNPSTSQLHVVGRQNTKLIKIYLRVVHYYTKLAQSKLSTVIIRTVFL